MHKKDENERDGEEKRTIVFFFLIESKRAMKRTTTIDGHLVLFFNDLQNIRFFFFNCSEFAYILFIRNNNDIYSYTMLYSNILIRAEYRRSISSRFIVATAP